MEIKAVSSLSCEQLGIDQDCKTKTELDEYWHNSNLEIKFINEFFDTYNTVNPKQSALDNGFLYMHSHYTNKLNLYFETSTFTILDWLVF